MKILILTLFFSIYSFGQSNPACGRAIAKDEMEVLSQEMTETYHYKESDIDAQADVMDEIMGLYDDNYIFEVTFFMKDRSHIGIKLTGSFNQEIEEKLSCYLLATKIKGLPEKRFLLFYDVTSKALVYKVTNEK